MSVQVLADSSAPTPNTRVRRMAASRRLQRHATATTRPKAQHIRPLHGATFSAHTSAGRRPLTQTAPGERTRRRGGVMPPASPSMLPNVRSRSRRDPIPLLFPCARSPWLLCVRKPSRSLRLASGG